MNKVNCFYGLVSPFHAVEIAQRVCEVLGNGRYGVAYLLILETACAETMLGQFNDPTPKYAGNGLCQHDKIPFYDIAKRTSEKNRKLILDNFGFDIRKTKWIELCYSPLLAFIFCRLHYKLIREEIPDTRTGRAGYWKKYYNTKAGRGTPEHYLKQIKLSNLNYYLPIL